MKNGAKKGTLHFFNMGTSKNQEFFVRARKRIIPNLGVWQHNTVRWK